MGRPISLKFSLKTAGEYEAGDTVEEDNFTSEENPAEWLLFFLGFPVGRSDYRSLLQFWMYYCYKETQKMATLLVN